MEEKCTYCGMSKECREHVIPVVWLSMGRSYNSDLCWIVPSCSICNSLAGAKIVFSIPEKAEYIAKRFKIKYKKILNFPEWTEEEIKKMSYSFRKSIWGRMVAKRVATEKLNFLEIVSQYPLDYKRPKFIENQILETKIFLKSLEKKKKRKRYENKAHTAK
jgi:predicted nucleotidyltransferase